MKTIYLSVLFLFCLTVVIQISFFEHPQKLLTNEFSKVNLYDSNFISNPVHFTANNNEDYLYKLNETNGLAFDNNSHIYVVEHSKSQIVKYDDDGVILKTIKIVDGFPLHIIKAYNSNDMIFTNVTDHSVNKLSEDGTITKLYKGAPLHIPVGLLYNSDGILYISNHEDKKVFTLNGEHLNYVKTLPGNKPSSCKKEEE